MASRLKSGRSIILSFIVNIYYIVYGRGGQALDISHICSARSQRQITALKPCVCVYYYCNTVTMSAGALIALSKEIDAAIPHLMLMALGRKVVHAIGKGMVTLLSCSPLWEHKIVTSLRTCYDTVERWFQCVWTAFYMLLVVYFAYDTVSNSSDFIACKPHNVPRPIGIFCAVALTCLVFTTKLSTSMFSIVVMLCAKDMNLLTGLACVVNFSVWANIKGTWLTLLAVSILSALHFLFCRLGSSATLSTVGVSWCVAWAWLGFVDSTLSSVKTMFVPKDD